MYLEEEHGRQRCQIRSFLTSGSAAAGDAREMITEESFARAGIPANAVRNRRPSSAETDIHGAYRQVQTDVTMLRC